MFSLFFGFMGFLFWLSFQLISVFFAIATQLTILVVNGIIGAIGMLFCAASAVSSNKPAKSHPRVEKVTVIKEVSRQPSRRELKEREKEVKRELKKQMNELEYDMLMMMEVAADD